ncbi:MAG: hypothetical protein K8S25_05910 [Alphaproteobacteria bacterium]|nr:hypothetical protein [Alphaproteobacteria bacterium]
MRLTSLCLALLSVFAVATARADDFASDLAACAATPIEATKFAVGPARDAAVFLANHGECVPPVVAGDPLLVGMSGGVAALMAHGDVPKGAQACVDASIGSASKAVAAAINAVPGFSTVLPSKSQQLLTEIAQGTSQATLYDVPGVAIVMDKISCSCAVASTGLKAAELKDQLGGVMGSVGGCGKLTGKILSGAYDAGKAATAAAGSAAKKAYEAAKSAINAVGCTLGLGGCGSSGPPFFCVGFNQMRAGGTTPENIAAMFPAIFPAEFINNQVTACEKGWLAAIEKAKQDLAAKKEAERLAEENEKAVKLGAANGLGYAFRWSPKCFDEQCKKSIALFADKYTADIQDPDTIKQYGSFGAAKAKLDSKYGSLAEVAVALSKDRVHKALRADVNAAPVDRLPAFGCTNWLGRANQSLCKNNEGFKVCKDYALNDKWDLCVLAGKPGRFYSAGAGLDRVLRQSGCIPEPIAPTRSTQLRIRGLTARDTLRAQCLSPQARVHCDRLATGGSSVNCEGPEVLLLRRVALAAIRQIEPPAPPPEEPPPVQFRPLRPLAPIVAPQPQRPAVAPAVETSTLCRFTSGPRAGQTQDYAPMAPIPVGSNCQDARGSFGTVVAR